MADKTPIYKIKIFDSSTSSQERDIGAYVENIMMERTGEVTLTSQLNIIKNNIADLQNNKVAKNELVEATTTSAGLMSASDKTKLNAVTPSNYVLKDQPPVASKTAFGMVKINNGLAITDAGELNLAPATSSTLGGVKLGETISIQDGVINVNIKEIESGDRDGCIQIIHPGEAENSRAFVGGWNKVIKTQTVEGAQGQEEYVQVPRPGIDKQYEPIVRNIKYTKEDPGVGASYLGENGDLICVFEE